MCTYSEMYTCIYDRFICNFHSYIHVCTHPHTLKRYACAIRFMYILLYTCRYMYICSSTHTYMYMYTYIHRYMYKHLNLYVYKYRHIHGLMHAYMIDLYIYWNVYTSLHTNTHTRMYARKNGSRAFRCIHTYMYTCMYCVYMYR